MKLISKDFNYFNLQSKFSKISHSKFNYLINRNFHSTNSNLIPGFCLDIDGVLKLGSHILPQAKKALKILNGFNQFNKKFPFIFCTNGGGISEKDRSINLSQELGIPIKPSQLIQSHTIFNQFLNLYRHEPILVIGGPNQQCRLIAQEYGFENVYIPQDILNWNPTVWPFHKLSDHQKLFTKTVDFSNVIFSAIFVMHDPLDWGLATQIAIDLLTSNGRIISHQNLPSPKDHHQIPIYFSNPDILWTNEFPRPRFGQGAFQTALCATYQQLTGQTLKTWTGGKPSLATYKFANQLLNELIKKDFESQQLGNVYMIGDNPASDIQGANNFGWSSILVKTGVFQGEKSNQAEYHPTTLQDDVLEAIKWALNQEGFGDALQTKKESNI